MNKLIIPKEVFENMFFAQGGEKKETYQKLTGSKQFEEKTQDIVNANVEDNEWISDSQGLRQVEGKKHSEGGVDVHLEDGAKVLSDKGVLGKTLASQLNKQYEVSLKASTTYAEALDKIQIKLGLDKIVKEQEKLIAKIDYQQKNVKDENTLSANLELLSGKLKDLEDKKRPLEEQSTEVFNKLFEAQESKKSDNQQNNNGVFADGGTNPPFRVANVLENWETYKHQKEIPNLGSGIFGSEINKAQAIPEIRRLFPQLASKYLQGDSLKPSDVKAFQQDTQRYYYELDDAAKRLYGENSDKYQQFKAQLQRDGFTDQSVNTDVRSFDGKFGNFTSTRPNYELELLPEDVQKKVKDAGVNTVGQLKEKFPEEYKTYIETLDFKVPEDAWLGKTAVNVPVTPETQQEISSTEPTNTPSEATSSQTEVARTGVLNMPDQSPLLPTSMESHLKTNRRYERLDFRDISPEQQLMELNKLTERAENNLDVMPPQQKASLSASLLATQADQTSKILSQTNQFNTQGQQQIDNMNAQIQVQEANATAQDALNYEQRQLLAEAKTEADYINFYNTLQANNMMNYNTINNLNLSNAIYDHFQFTDQGIESKGYSPQFRRAYQLAQLQAERDRIASQPVQRKKQ